MSKHRVRPERREAIRNIRRSAEIRKSQYPEAIAKTAAKNAEVMSDLMSKVLGPYWKEPEDKKASS